MFPLPQTSFNLITPYVLDTREAFLPYCDSYISLIYSLLELKQLDRKLNYSTGETMYRGSEIIRNGEGTQVSPNFWTFQGPWCVNKAILDLSDHFSCQVST